MESHTIPPSAGAAATSGVIQAFRANAPREMFCIVATNPLPGSSKKPRQPIAFRLASVTCLRSLAPSTFQERWGSHDRRIAWGLQRRSLVVCVIRPSLETGEMERLLVFLELYSVGVTLQTFLKTRQK